MPVSINDDFDESGMELAIRGLEQQTANVAHLLSKLDQNSVHLT